MTQGDKSAVSATGNDLSPSRQENLIFFISDLHLCESRPDINAAFIKFLDTEALRAHSLYILGDLFEYWAGDDDIDDAFHQTVIAGFQALANSGTRIYLMHGNRDFLIGEAFCKTAKITLLNDPCVIESRGRAILLSHGDALCTDDTEYQQFRTMVRNSNWQKEFLAQPLAVRKDQIAQIRARSEKEKHLKSMAIMDVNNDALEKLLREFNYPALFIHGHTHRPKQHKIKLDGHDMTRVVLGDWYEQGSYLACALNGCTTSYL